MKEKQNLPLLTQKQLIFSLVLVVAVICTGVYYGVTLLKNYSSFNTTPSSGVGYLTPMPQYEKPIPVFRVPTPNGFSRYDTNDLVVTSLFIENRWAEDLIHHPDVDILQVPTGIPQTAPDLMTFLSKVSSSDKSKDCSTYVTGLWKNVQGLSSSMGGLSPDKCWFRDVQKIEKMSSIGGFPTLKFHSTYKDQNKIEESDNVAIDVVSGGKHYLVLISYMRTEISDERSDVELKRAMTEIIKNISFVK